MYTMNLRQRKSCEAISTEARCGLRRRGRSYSEEQRFLNVRYEERYPKARPPGPAPSRLEPPRHSYFRRQYLGDLANGSWLMESFFAGPFLALARTLGTLAVPVDIEDPPCLQYSFFGSGGYVTLWVG